ncbi:hypothetical protein [Actinotalea solisilvae]|uniref:hypothetical protein n=1 Tax=Actinotalea solisilvae TaxID=2072922 RepID=UPI0018F22125|nr:hypothetical protein [Actinotalea solisilvae]
MTSAVPMLPRARKAPTTGLRARKTARWAVVTAALAALVAAPAVTAAPAEALTYTTGGPAGNLDVAAAVPGGVQVKGWAWDPDTTAAVTVKVTVGAVNGQGPANRSRPDVATVFPAAGTNRGYDITVPTAAGSQKICVTYVNVGNGSNKVFSCRTVTVATGSTAPAPAPAPAPTTPPVPNATNTGVPAGTPLTVHNGDLTITTPGAVISNLDIRGFVRVKANNVTIKNSIIRGRPGLTSYMSLIQNGDQANKLTVIDSELIPSEKSPYIDGIVGKNFSLIRVEIRDVVDQVKITGNDVLVQDSFLHSNLHYLQDPNYGNTPTHDDNVQIQRGTNITIKNSVLQNSHNAAMMITQDSGDVGTVTVTGSRLSGGACTINVAEKSYGPIQGMRVTNNVFGLDTRHARCAVLMPLTTSSISTVTGNTFTDGSTVTVSKG